MRVYLHAYMHACKDAFCVSVLCHAMPCFVMSYRDVMHVCKHVHTIGMYGAEAMAGEGLVVTMQHNIHILNPPRQQLRAGTHRASGTETLNTLLTEEPLYCPDWDQAQGLLSQAYQCHRL